MSLREMLEATKAEIDKPQKWCRGISKDHRRICAVNAIDRLALAPRDYNRVIAALHTATNGRSIAEFNDTHTHAEIMALFDQAIAQAA